MYEQSNKIERLFRRLKGFQPILTRLEKDVIYIGHLPFASLGSRVQISNRYVWNHGIFH